MSRRKQHRPHHILEDENTSNASGNMQAHTDVCGLHDNTIQQLHAVDESSPNEQDVMDAAQPSASDQPPGVESSEGGESSLAVAKDIDTGDPRSVDSQIRTSNKSEPVGSDIPETVAVMDDTDEGVENQAATEPKEIDEEQTFAPQSPGYSAGDKSPRRSSGRRRSSTILYNVDHEAPRFRGTPPKSSGGATVAKKIKMDSRKCPFCHIQKKSPSDLERHLRSHTGDKPFVCQVCQKEFKAKRSVQYHEYMEHGIESKETNLMDRYRERKIRMAMEKKVASDYLGVGSRRRGRLVNSYNAFNNTGGAGLDIKTEPADWSFFSESDELNDEIKMEPKDFDVLNMTNKPNSEERLSLLGGLSNSAMQFSASSDLNRNGVADSEGNVSTFGSGLGQLGESEFKMFGKKSVSEISVEDKLELNSTHEKHVPTFDDDDSNDSMIFIDKNGTEFVDQDSFDQDSQSVQSLSFNADGSFSLGTSHINSDNQSTPGGGSIADNNMMVDQGSNTIVLDLDTVQLETGIDVTNMTKEEKRAYFLSKRTCLHCGKVCPKPSDLKRHLLVHSGERPYKCRGCDRAFKSKGSLSYHEKTNHNFNIDLSQGLNERYLKLKEKELRRCVGDCGKPDDDLEPKQKKPCYENSHQPCYQFFGGLDTNTVQQILNQNMNDIDGDEIPSKEYPQLRNALGYDGQSMTGQWTVIGAKQGKNDSQKEANCLSVQIKSEPIDPADKQINSETTNSEKNQLSLTEIHLPVGLPASNSIPVSTESLLSPPMCTSSMMTPTITNVCSLSAFSESLASTLESVVSSINDGVSVLDSALPKSEIDAVNASLNSSSSDPSSLVKPSTQVADATTNGKPNGADVVASCSQEYSSRKTPVSSLSLQTTPVSVTQSAPSLSATVQLKIPNVSVIQQGSHSKPPAVSQGNTIPLGGHTQLSRSLQIRPPMGPTGSTSQEHLMSLIRAPPAPLPNVLNPEMLSHTRLFGPQIHYRQTQPPQPFSPPHHDNLLNNFTITKETSFITKVDALDKKTGGTVVLYKCHQCMGKVFDSMDKVKDHMTSHTAIGSNLPYRCPVCQAAFKFRIILLRHLRSLHHWNVEEKEDFSIPSHEQETANTSEKNNPNEPPAVEIPDERLSDMDLLEEDLSSPSLTDSLSFDIEEGMDLAALKSPDQEDSHNDMIKNVFESNNHISSLLGAVARPRRFDGLFRCRYCPKTFFRYFCLQRHERVHTGIKTCYCKQCGRGFSELRNLRHHILRFHSGLDRQELFKLLARGSPSKKVAEPYVKGLIGREVAPRWPMAMPRVGPLQLPLHPPERPPSASTSTSHMSQSPVGDPEQSTSVTSLLNTRLELRSHLEEKIRRKEGVSDDITIVIPSDMPLDGSPATATEPEDNTVDAVNDVENAKARPRHDIISVQGLEPSGQGQGQVENDTENSKDHIKNNNTLETKDMENSITVIKKHELITLQNPGHNQSKPESHSIAGNVNQSCDVDETNIRFENPSAESETAYKVSEPAISNGLNMVIGSSSSLNIPRPESAHSINMVGMTSPPPIFSPSFLGHTSLAQSYGMTQMNLPLSVNTNGSVGGIQMSAGGGIQMSPGGPYSLSPRGPFLSPQHMSMLPFSSALLNVPGGRPMFQAPMMTSTVPTMTHPSYVMYPPRPVGAPVRTPPRSYLQDVAARYKASEAGVDMPADDKQRKYSNLSRTHSRVEVICDPQKHEESATPIFLPDGRTLYRCSYCAKEFPNYSDIRRHLNFHEDVRPFKCKMCQYSARTSSQLKVHMMRHQGIREFKCHICHYEGVTQSDLNRHLRSQSHLYLERMGNKCKQCGEDYTSRQVMNHGHICKAQAMHPAITLGMKKVR